MTAPRRLWSGDWQVESAAHAEELANRRAQTRKPAATRPELDAPRSTRSGLARAVAWLQGARERLARRNAHERRLAPRNARERRLTRGNARARQAAVLILPMLLAGGATYAVVSALTGSSAQSPATSSEAPGWLGVDMASFPFGGGSLPLAAGALIADVAPGSPAAAAGLEPGDVITQIDNRPVASPSDVEAALAGMHAGEHVQIQYSRLLITYGTEATLARRPLGHP